MLEMFHDYLMHKGRYCIRLKKLPSPEEIDLFCAFASDNGCEFHWCGQEDFVPFFKELFPLFNDEDCIDLFWEDGGMMYDSSKIYADEEHYTIIMFDELIGHIKHVNCEQDDPTFQGIF